MAQGVVNHHIPQWVSLEPNSVREFGPGEVFGVRWRPTAEELDVICESHREWLEPDGEDGQKADLSEANLRDADLTDVGGLQVGQLRGATVSLAELPNAVKNFAGLDTAKATTRSAKKLFISVLAACGYAALAIALKTGGSGNVVLPIIGLGMETQDFFLVTPGLLALLFGYFHLQMQRLWGELAQLPAIFPDGKPLDEKVHPWLITGLVQAHVKRLKERKSPPFFPLQRFVAVLLAWGAVPTTLGYFAWMYPLDSGAWGSFFLHTLAALTASGAYVAYRKAARTLQLRDHHPITFWKSETTDKKWILKSAGFRIGVALLIVAVSIWYVRFYGLPCGATSSNFSVGIVYWQNFSSVFFPPPVECQCQPPGSLL